MGQYARTGVYAFYGGLLAVVNHDERTGRMTVALCYPNQGSHYPAKPVPGQSGTFFREGGWAYGEGSIGPSAGSTSSIQLRNFYAEQQWKTPDGRPIISIETPPFGAIRIDFPVPGQLSSLHPGLLIGENPASWYRGPKSLLLSSKLAGDCPADSPFAKYAGIWEVDSYILLLRPGRQLKKNLVEIYLLFLGHNEQDKVAGHGNPLQLEPYFVVGRSKARLDGHGMLRMKKVQLLNHFAELHVPALDRPIFDFVDISLPNPDTTPVLENGVVGIGAPNWQIGKTSFPIRRVAGFHEPCPTPATVGVV